MQPRKILVATDFDASSDRAVEEAIALAVGLDASIDLVHVEPLPPASPATIYARGPAELAEVTFAHERLNALAERIHALEIPVTTHLAVGSVVFGLLDVIDRVQPTMVVVGSHGRGAVKRALVGSVAESLVRRSPVPVVVVPPAWRAQLAAGAAWACADCGRLVGAAEAKLRCHGCGGARFISAPITGQAVDIDEPAIGESDAETIAPAQANAPTALFATSPAGTEGYDVNPELKVRY
jgi:nucleotide-binding universal stress UspA family protein